MDKDTPRLIHARDLMVARLPERQMLIDPLFTTKTLALLYGPRGLGKTFVAMGIAWAAASGGSFLDWRASQPRRVVYLDGEMAAAEMRDRLALFGPVPETLMFMLADLGTAAAIPDLGTPRGQADLLALFPQDRPQLLVIDNLASLVGFRSRDPDPWRTVQRFLMMLRRLRIAVLIVHHANKRGQQRGTSRREDIVDLVMAIRRPPDYLPSEGARFELHFEKTRSLFGATIDPIEARLTVDADGRAQWSWSKTETHELGRVAALLRDGLNPNQIARELGISKTKAYRLRQQLTTTATA